MKINCDWFGKKSFIANVNGLKVHMETAKPFGSSSIPLPKELVLAEMCGSTGVEIVDHLCNYKQLPVNFQIEAEASLGSEYLNELKDIKVNYVFDGPCDSSRIVEAVQAAQDKYCAVSSAILRGANIAFQVLLNGVQVAQGEAAKSKLEIEDTRLLEGRVSCW